MLRYLHTKPEDPLKRVQVEEYHCILMSWEEAIISPELPIRHLSIQLMLGFFYLLMQPFVTVSNGVPFPRRNPLSHLLWPLSNAFSIHVTLQISDQKESVLLSSRKTNTMTNGEYIISGNGLSCRACLVTRCECVNWCGTIGRVVGTLPSIKGYSVIFMSGFFFGFALK